MRVITLPNGRRVPLDNYVSAWQELKLVPPAQEFRGWDHFPQPASRILSDMRRGLHDRISAHLPWYRVGRAWSADHQQRVRWMAQRANTPRYRLRPSDVPQRYRKRLEHRLDGDE